MKTPCVPSKTVLGPINPDFAILADCHPQPAAQPGWRRFVEVPSAKYSIIPEAILPTIPRAELISFILFPITEEIPIDDPKAPKMAVGWKPCLWTAVGATRANLQISSEPTTKPFRKSSPEIFLLWAADSIAGTITAPTCTGVPSNVSSKSSPWTAVPFMIAALKGDVSLLWPIKVQFPFSCRASIKLII